MRKQATLKELCYEYSEDDLLCPPNEQIAADCLVRIFDEFAIGFGEYLDSLTTEDMGTLSIKELLEIYKKEKGL